MLKEGWQSAFFAGQQLLFLRFYGLKQTLFSLNMIDLNYWLIQGLNRIYNGCDKLYIVESTSSIKAKIIVSFIMQLFESCLFIRPQMDSLLASVTQSQQIARHQHNSNLFYGAPQQNANSHHYIRKSPNSLYGPHTQKAQNFQDPAVFQSNISAQSKLTVQSYSASVSDGFEQQFMAYNHHQKISCLLDVLRIYRKLVAEHGLFLLTKDHLKIDFIGRPMVFISHDIGATQPSLPLNNNKFHELKVVQQFIDLFRKYFSELFFKYAKIRNLQDLQKFFIMVKKRNEIHKRCKHIVQKMSRNSMKTSLSTKHIPSDISASKRYDLQKRPSSFFRAFNSRSNQSFSMSSKHYLSASNFVHRKQGLEDQRKSELDTTNISCSALRQNKSFLEIKNTQMKTDAKRKSCLVKTNHQQTLMANFANKSSMVSKNREYKDEFTKVLQKENKQEYQSCKMEMKEEGDSQMQNSLQMRLKDLFLSQIVEDSQNEILYSGGNHQNLNQFFQDFENVFY